MKKFFKEIVFLLVGVFVITNIINLLRTPKLDVDPLKYFPKDTEIVYFYTDWCKVCKLEKPFIKNIEDTLKVVRVNAQKQKDISSAFKIKAYPTIIYLKNAKVVYMDIGLTSSFSIMMKSYLLKLLK